MAKHILTSISTYCCSHFNDSTRMGTKPTLETEEKVLIKCIAADSYVYSHITELMGRHQQAKTFHNFQPQLHIAHCHHSRDYSVER